jgi:hypothetical protein
MALDTVDKPAVVAPVGLVARLDDTLLSGKLLYSKQLLVRPDKLYHLRECMPAGEHLLPVAIMPRDSRARRTAQARVRMPRRTPQ